MAMAGMVGSQVMHHMAALGGNHSRDHPNPGDTMAVAEAGVEGARKAEAVVKWLQKTLVAVRPDACHFFLPWHVGCSEADKSASPSGGLAESNVHVESLGRFEDLQC